MYQKEHRPPISVDSKSYVNEAQSSIRRKDTIAQKTMLRRKTIDAQPSTAEFNELECTFSDKSSDWSIRSYTFEKTEVLSWKKFY